MAEREKVFRKHSLQNTTFKNPQMQPGRSTMAINQSLKNLSSAEGDDDQEHLWELLDTDGKGAITKEEANTGGGKTLLPGGK